MNFLKKQKRNITGLLCRALVLSILGLAVISCGKYGKLKITTDVNDNPVIDLKNPCGKAITIFSPSPENGSLGVESGGTITWVKGMPEVSKKDKQTTDFIWPLSAGTPVARPLFLEYPEQQESWNDWETSLFGKDILVSVIWEDGKSGKDVYLPEGETWIDAWNKTEYEGGQYIKVRTEAYKIALSIREGSAIDLGDLNELYRESLSIASTKANMTDLEAAEGWN